MEKKVEFISSFQTELKRGTMTLAVLSQLKKPEYGYSLLEKLIAKAIPIESNTLYPLLRRLEKQGVLDSEWDTTESRPRKYYKHSKFGLEVFELLTSEWEDTMRIMDQILKEG